MKAYLVLREPQRAEQEFTKLRSSAEADSEAAGLHLVLQVLDSEIALAQPEGPDVLALKSLANLIETVEGVTLESVVPTPGLEEAWVVQARMELELGSVSPRTIGRLGRVATSRDDRLGVNHPETLEVKRLLELVLDSTGGPEG